jgi:hypothetical protein
MRFVTRAECTYQHAQGDLDRSRGARMRIGSHELPRIVARLGASARKACVRQRRRPGGAGRRGCLGKFVASTLTERENVIFLSCDWGATQRLRVT